jgi:hypothetical protein
MVKVLSGVMVNSLKDWRHDLNIKHLPSKDKVLSSNTNTAKKLRITNETEATKNRCSQNK